MASIIFIAPDFVFTDELVGKFMNDDKTKKVNAAMNDRHSKLSIKEAEIAKREFDDKSIQFGKLSDFNNE
jgi:hypothetical protein